jgi:alkanesulfonate monooxygenase SsuD/methylene tetrahydromethanopterin reductase-like flavin-dependent oxidoreductase (luciferase family)
VDFGYHYSNYRRPEGTTLRDSLLDDAQKLDEGGFDFLTYMDHLWQVPQGGMEGEKIVDCYSALNAAAAVTENITLGALVTCVHFRNPGLLALKLASLDTISNGRAVCSLGAGWRQEEFDAFGYEFPDTATRIDKLEETTRLIKTVLSSKESVTFDGDHFDVSDAVPPETVQDPHPPILVGGTGEKLTLRVVAEHADWWNAPQIPMSEFKRKLDVLREHCQTVGRDFEDIKKTLLNKAVIRDTEEKAHEAYEQLMQETGVGPSSRDDHRGYVGTESDVIADLRELENAGVDMFILESPRNDPKTVNKFIHEIVPALA